MEELGVVGAISCRMLRKRESPVQDSGGKRTNHKSNQSVQVANMVSPAYLAVSKRYFGHNTSGCVASSDLYCLALNR